MAGMELKPGNSGTGSQTMDFDLSPEQRQVLEYGDAVAQKYDRKYWMDCAEKHVFPEALYQQVADDGIDRQLGRFQLRQTGGEFGIGQQPVVARLEVRIDIDDRRHDRSPDVYFRHNKTGPAAGLR